MANNPHTTPTIEDAARVLIAHSPYAASVLGKRTPGSPIYQQLYNRVAAQVLATANSGLSPDERDVVAQHMALSDGDEMRTFMLRVRLTESERAELQRLADEARLGMSEYVRSRLFG